MGGRSQTPALPDLGDRLAGLPTTLAFEDQPRDERATYRSGDPSKERVFR